MSENKSSTKKRQETFKYLLEKDCSKYTKTSPANKANYLSWSYAWQEFKKVYPFAWVEMTKNSYGTYELKDAFGTFFVEVTVHNGGEKSDGEYTAESHTVALPIMDNKHKPMKAEPYEYTTKYGTKTVAGATAFDTNYAIQRAKTKAISDFGLGLYIYHGEATPEDCGIIEDVHNEDPVKTAQNEIWNYLCNSGLGKSMCEKICKGLKPESYIENGEVSDKYQIHVAEYLQDYNIKLTQTIMEKGGDLHPEGFKNEIEENIYLLKQFKQLKEK